MKAWGALVAVAVAASSISLGPKRSLAGSDIMLVPPDYHCRIAPNEGWQEPECWAWGQIREGKVADFDTKLGEEAADQRQDERRKLGKTFLETVLFDDTYAEALTFKGVRIKGAYFPDEVDLENAATENEIWLRNSWFKEKVNLSGFGVRHMDLRGSHFSKAADFSYLNAKVSLFLQGTNFLKELNLRHANVGGDIRLDAAVLSHQEERDVLVPLRLDEAKIGGNVSMSGGDFGDVSLNHTTIDGTLTIHNARFFGPLVMNSLNVKSHLSIAEESNLVSVNLVGAHIGGQFALSHSFVTEEADLDGITVDAAVYLDGSEFFLGALNAPPLELAGAKIAGQLSAEQAYFESGLDLNWTTIEGGAIFRLAEFAGQLNLRYVEIQEILDLSGSDLMAVDLEGAKIADELRLYSKDYEGAYWADAGWINLGRASAATIRDAPSAWPAVVYMRDFSYQQWAAIKFRGSETGPGESEEAPDQWAAFELKGHTPERAADTTLRPISWFTEWLAREPSFSMQPYAQLAGIFLHNGKFEESEEVLYHGLKRKTSETRGLERIWLSTLHVTSGYGYRFDRFLLWVAVLTVVGAVVLRTSKQAKQDGLSNGLLCVLYSANVLVPVIDILPERYANIHLTGWIEYYFIVHKIAGVILAASLVTGVAERVFGGI